LYLGCSITEGVGIALEHTFSYILTNKIKTATGLQIPFMSLAAGNFGLDAITRALCLYHKQIKPDIIIAYFPAYRREFKENKKWIIASANNNELFDQNPKFIDPYYTRYEDEKNLYVINRIADIYDSLIIWDSWDNRYVTKPNSAYLPRFSNRADIFYQAAGYKTPHARDGIHPGTRWHDKVADILWQDYKEKILQKCRMVGAPGIEPGQER
jgi:hypothetical protein